jgi:hypothetical protein
MKSLWPELDTFSELSRLSWIGIPSLMIVVTLLVLTGAVMGESASASQVLLYMFGSIAVSTGAAIKLKKWHKLIDRTIVPKQEPMPSGPKFLIENCIDLLRQVQ